LGVYSGKRERSPLRCDQVASANPRDENVTLVSLHSPGLEGAVLRLGEKERALEWISRALIIEPEDVQDHFNLACAFLY